MSNVNILNHVPKRGRGEGGRIYLRFDEHVVTDESKRVGSKT